MELQTTREGNKVTVAITGVIDTDTSAALSDALLALDYDGLDLTLDFQHTDYITSAGLRVLLVARKRLSDETMRLINVNDSIAEVFDTTGFSDLLNISRVSNIDESRCDLSFKALLRKKAEQAADKTVFVFCGREYNWQDVDRASQIIADDLAAMGVKKGSHVGICSPNTINWIFTFFGIQKLGAVAVLLNFKLHPAEIAKLCQIGGITHLAFGATPGITDYATFTQAVMSVDCPVKHTYDISPDCDFTARFNEYPALADKYTELFHADDAGVIIFSSGSTGTPKAILASSRNMLKSMVPLAKEFHFHEADRNLAFLPLFHVFGFATCISAALLCDLTSYFPTKGSPAALIEMIDRYQCTVFNSVPTMMLGIIQSPDFSPEKVASLRLSVLGGAATTEAQMNLLRGLFPNNHFSNIYGMSENAAISITDYEDTVEHITKTIGKPVEGVKIEIRDIATGKPLPRGQVGEICVNSDAMVVCYYHLPIEKQPLDENGWLATGDLGMIDDDGYLRLTGRVKDLIIRGGENISPGEIADAISTMPEIADVKVLGVPDEIFGEEIAAVLILKENAVFDEAKTRAYLSGLLAKFKIPKYFVIKDSFPLLGSGKVDAVALKKQVAEAVNTIG